MCIRDRRRAERGHDLHALRHADGCGDGHRNNDAGTVNATTKTLSSHLVTFQEDSIFPPIVYGRRISSRVEP
eukprot:4226585-Pyramimonas_sp.AAC.1